MVTNQLNFTILYKNEKYQTTLVAPSCRDFYIKRPFAKLFFQVPAQ